MSAADAAPIAARSRRRLVVDARSGGSVPMVNAAGMVGFTVTGVDLVEGVLRQMTGVWRTQFGLARKCPGQVVVELLAPTTDLSVRDRVDVRVSVATTRSWCWIGHARLGVQWPLVIGPLVWIERQRTLSTLAARPRPGADQQPGRHPRGDREHLRSVPTPPAEEGARHVADPLESESGEWVAATPAEIPHREQRVELVAAALSGRGVLPPMPGSFSGRLGREAMP